MLMVIPWRELSSSFMALVLLSAVNGEYLIDGFGGLAFLALSRKGCLVPRFRGHGSQYSGGSL